MRVQYRSTLRPMPNGSLVSDRKPLAATRLGMASLAKTRPPFLSLLLS
jgi:hypothetical protein